MSRPIRFFAPLLLLAMTSLVGAEEVAMIHSEVLSYVPRITLGEARIVLPVRPGFPARVEVDATWGEGNTDVLMLELPAAQVLLANNFISTAYFWKGEDRKFYLGARSHYSSGAVVHPEPAVYVPQVRWVPASQRVEWFLDTDITQPAREAGKGQETRVAAREGNFEELYTR